MSQYGTKYVESECILAAAQKDEDVLDRLLADMLPVERVKLREAAEYLINTINLYGGSKSDFGRDGEPVRGVQCPICDRETVVYNGNYFCSRAGCWVMSGDGPDGVTYRDNVIIATFLKQERDKPGASQQTKDHMQFYLNLMPKALQ